DRDVSYGCKLLRQADQAGHPGAGAALDRYCGGDRGDDSAPPARGGSSHKGHERHGHGNGGGGDRGARRRRNGRARAPTARRPPARRQQWRQRQWRPKLSEGGGPERSLAPGPARRSSVMSRKAWSPMAKALIGACALSALLAGPVGAASDGFWIGGGGGGDRG